MKIHSITGKCATKRSLIRGRGGRGHFKIVLPYLIRKALYKNIKHRSNLKGYSLWKWPFHLLSLFMLKSRCNGSKATKQNMKANKHRYEYMNIEISINCLCDD